MASQTPAKQFVETGFGRIAYLESGRPERPPVLFVHGIPTSSYLWRHVLSFLQDDFHCLAPDLMGLGDTDVDPERTAFHMEAQAEMLLAFMDALDIERFALVCHDQGGAAAQILATRFPERITAFVLTDCVAYDNWPVPAIRRLQRFAQLGPLAEWLNRTGATEWLQAHTPLSDFKRGVFDRGALSVEAIAEYLRPLRQSDRARRRFRNFLLAGHERYTQTVAEDLRSFDRPTLIVWAGDDFYLSPSWGRKLLEDIPGAERMELVPFCGHFWQEERPAEFAAHIGAFIHQALRAEAAQPEPARAMAAVPIELHRPPEATAAVPATPDAGTPKAAKPAAVKAAAAKPAGAKAKAGAGRKSTTGAAKRGASKRKSPRKTTKE